MNFWKRSWPTARAALSGSGSGAVAQWRSDGELIADEQRQTFQQHLAVAFNALHLPGLAVKADLQRLVNIAGAAPGEILPQRIGNDGRFGRAGLGRQSFKLGGQRVVEIEVMARLHGSLLRSQAADRHGDRSFH